MKDYREFSRPYNPREWENNDGWIIARLDFLWTLREFYPEVYAKGFAQEKYDLYIMYPKLIQAANVINSNQYASNYDYYYCLFKNWSKEEAKLALENLISIKHDDMDLFLRNRLYIKYILLQEYLEANK